MLKISHCFYTAFLFLAASPLVAQDFNPHHLFIKMKNGHNLNPSSHIDSSQELITGLYLVKTNNLAALEKEALNWDIEYLQKDHLHQNDPIAEVKAYSLPSQQWSRTRSSSLNDEFLNKIWAFNDNWGMSVTKAYENLPSWNANEIIVAVIDTGVDYHHEDLKNMMWRNSREIPGDGIDNDGNGYVDDIHGINTLVRDRRSKKASGNPMASSWHGTHVAGTIAAEGNNGLGIAGVAHNVKIMAIRSIPDSANEADSNIAESLLYAAKNGAKVINCSFGKKKTDGFVIRDIINTIGEKYGVLVVIAVGNNSKSPFYWYDIDSKPQYPASLENSNILTVAATTNKGELASFSNIGLNSVDLAAPGHKIFSTMNKNKYTDSSGTSMAAPNVSGVAAMVLGYFPQLTPIQLREILMKSVKRSPSLVGKMMAPGVVNLEAALAEAARYTK